MNVAKFSGHRKTDGFDAELGNRLIAVKRGIAALRNVRGGLLELAYAVAERPGTTGVLVLPDVSVTPRRLQDEWMRASSVFRPDVLGRLS